MNLGEQVKRLRSLSGLTQDQLAARAGITRMALSRIETGHSGGRGNLPEIARVLGVPVEDLGSREPIRAKHNRKTGISDTRVTLALLMGDYRPARRICLCCKREFQSPSPSFRICPDCTYKPDCGETKKEPVTTTYKISGALEAPKVLVRSL